MSDSYVVKLLNRPNLTREASFETKFLTIAAPSSYCLDYNLDYQCTLIKDKTVQNYPENLQNANKNKIKSNKVFSVCEAISRIFGVNKSNKKS
jgi:hypothetical protein